MESHPLTRQTFSFETQIPYDRMAQLNPVPIKFVGKVEFVPANNDPKLNPVIRVPRAPVEI
jgi:hypothetical protein